MAMITASRRFELIFLTALPALVTLGLTILFLTSKHIAGLNHFMPLLPVIPVFYWGMTHAREMPYWFVFLLGLVLDAVIGTPMGLSSVVYVVFLILIHAQRKYIYKEGFVIKWGYFALLLGVISILNWLLLSFFNSRTEAFMPVLLQWLLTVCCYPLLHKGFDGVYDYMHSRRWQILHGQ